MSETEERGDIYFFYRSRIDVERPAGVDDIQRLFMVLAPDGGPTRLLIVGRKLLPEIREGESHPTERNWLMVFRVGRPEDVAGALHPVVYETATEGRRTQAEAIPAGQGRYALVVRGADTWLAYRLASPNEPGEAQRALNIRPEAAYLIAVRNPSVEVPGFPEEKPGYPEALAGMFAHERWIGISDPRLLDYENAQLVLIGAVQTLESAGVEVAGRADLFGRLGLDEAQWVTESLYDGRFARAGLGPEAVFSDTDRGRGGRRGGPEAARTDSAAGVARALKGVAFPRGRSGLVRHARANEAPPEVVDLLQSLPDREFADMAEVEKAVGEVR